MSEQRPWVSTGVVRDKYGRVCLDEEVFFEPSRLATITQQVRNEVNARDALKLKESENGCNT